MNTAGKNSEHHAQASGLSRGGFSLIWACRNVARLFVSTPCCRAHPFTGQGPKLPAQRSRGLPSEMGSFALSPDLQSQTQAP